MNINNKNIQGGIILNSYLGENLVIVKIGTNCILTRKKKNIRHKWMSRIAKDVKQIVDLGYKVVIVSSAAIRHGERSKFMVGKKIAPEVYGQIYSMIGQSLMVEGWRSHFNRVGIEICSIVYVNKDLKNPHRRHWTIKSLFTVLDHGLIPIINEDDGKTTNEIKALEGFGDNDYLAALTAIATKADKLIYLTTVPGVICPFKHTLLPEIISTERKIQKNIIEWNGQSNGGMFSKLCNGKFAVRKNSGLEVYIASYEEKDIVTRIVQGENVGTKIIP